MKRRVAKVIAPKKFEIFEEELPKLNNDQILLRIKSCGLCHSDVPVYSGEKQWVVESLNGKTEIHVSNHVDFPAVVGHEPVAVVEDIGKNISRFEIGDWVSGFKKLTSGDPSLIKGIVEI